MTSSVKFLRYLYSITSAVIPSKSGSPDIVIVSWFLIARIIRVTKGSIFLSRYGLHITFDSGFRN
ncbi:hypothetical protein D3C74_457510 [compost metagenome]